MGEKSGFITFAAAGFVCGGGRVLRLCELGTDRQDVADRRDKGAMPHQTIHIS